MLSVVEQSRLRVSKSTEAEKKSLFGQFLTPARTAQFMADLFSQTTAHGQCRLLDPGAGIGSLSSAFLECWLSKDLLFDSVEITACEIDTTLRDELRETLKRYSEWNRISVDICDGDFIEHAVNWIQFEPERTFTHAILNPPYKKINSNSKHRLLLRQVGIETVNLYPAFLALTLNLMVPGGHVVAIIPRSFCNGPYYRSFRELLLNKAAIRRMHLFDSRNKAFKDDSVLQENVIIVLECDGKQRDVIVSTSTDDTFGDLALNEYPFGRVVVPTDPQSFIHVPTSPKPHTLELYLDVRHTLEDLGIKVSTGPVVDFRVKAHLRKIPESDTVPLLYSTHFKGMEVCWPNPNFKKSNNILRNADTEKWLYPAGYYCVVRRFSSKEEKRRVVASVVDPKDLPAFTKYGFENHLNVFHENKEGLPEMLAKGIAVYLNTSAVDEHFRRFSGHTQVNANDLKLLKYPSRSILMRLGKWAMGQDELTQTSIDEQVEILCT